MAARAVWKGSLAIDGLHCPVALHTVVSPSVRLRFHILNRKTEHRVTRSYFDSGTGAAVKSEELERGFDLGGGDLLVLSPQDIAAALPESDKTLEVQGFIRCDEIDRLFFDRPYYLTPASPTDRALYAEICGGLRDRRVAAVAQAVLFRRLRGVLIRAHGAGMIATLLNFDHEVRSPDQAFSEIPDIEIKGEMLDLAGMILQRLRGGFDPASFTDRYESALAELIRAKAEGHKIPARKRRKVEPAGDLLEALRKSAAG